MSRVLHAVPEILTGAKPVIDHAEGVLLYDTEGRSYIDASGGAVVVGLGHGDREILAALEEQAGRVAYVNRISFTTEALEAYTSDLARLLPLDDPRMVLCSGGSESVETAFKLVRAYHLARDEPSRHKVIARRGGYHGATRGALDATDRPPYRRLYEPWLGQTRFVPRVYEYRCPLPDHPSACGLAHAERLEEAILAEGPQNVACFIGEPIGGTALGATVPTDDYWPAVMDVCRRYGVLVIADEIMTGFGRAGTWFAVDHWDVRPDIVVSGKGASSGYWPLGVTAIAGHVYEGLSTGEFIHGFTYGQSVVGAAVGSAVIRRMMELDLVEACRQKGPMLQTELAAVMGDHPYVGDIRGLGLMVAIEFVRDRATKAPFPRSDRFTEHLVRAGRDHGVYLYGSVGCADGTEGDLIMLGPPLTISPEEIREVAVRIGTALDQVSSQLTLT